MIIYGWGKDLKDVCYAGVEKCGFCQTFQHFSLKEKANHVSLYFVKVVRWSRELFYVCSNCDRAWQIPEQKRDEVLALSQQIPRMAAFQAIWGMVDAAINSATEKAENADMQKAWTDALNSLRQRLDMRRPPPSLYFMCPASPKCSTISGAPTCTKS